MGTAKRVGLLVVLVGAAVASALFLWRSPPSVRYAGSAAGVSATVALRLESPSAVPPQTVTVDLGNGVRLVASRLP